MTAGRPTSYTPQLGEKICDTIANSSVGLKQLCRQNPTWPSHETIYQWLRKYKEFADFYARAKKDQVNALVDDCFEIADDSSRDDKYNESGDVSCDGEWVSRCRLRVDLRKWVACKLVPRIYGDNAGMRELYEEIADLKRELANKGMKNGNTENSSAE